MTSSSSSSYTWSDLKDYLCAAMYDGILRTPIVKLMQIEFSGFSTTNNRMCLMCRTARWQNDATRVQKQHENRLLHQNFETMFNVLAYILSLSTTRFKWHYFDIQSLHNNTVDKIYWHSTHLVSLDLLHIIKIKRCDDGAAIIAVHYLTHMIETRSAHMHTMIVTKT